MVSRVVWALDAGTVWPDEVAVWPDEIAVCADSLRYVRQQSQRWQPASHEAFAPPVLLSSDTCMQLGRWREMKRDERR